MRAALPLAAILLLAAGSAGGVPDQAPPAARAAVAEGRQMRLEREHVVRVGTLAPFYSPPFVRVRVGDSVRWANGMLADTHGVRDVRRGVFSFEIPPGGEARFRFREPGEYVYRCRFHPWMTGRVLVEPRRLDVAWRDLPAGFDAVHLVARADGGGVVAVEGGTRPRAAAVSDEGVTLLGAPSRAVRGDAPPAVGSGGALFWLARDAAALVRLDPGGASAALALDQALVPAAPAASSSDGRIWLHDAAGGALVGVDPASGDAVRVPVAGFERPAVALAADAEGLWLLDGDGRVARVERAGGRVTPGPQLAPGQPAFLSADAGGAWLPGESTSLLRLGRDGRAVAFPVPLAGARITALAPDGHGAAWALTNTNALVRVGADGADVFELAPAPERGVGLVLDARGVLWLLDAARGRVGRVGLRGAAEDAVPGP